MHNDVQTLNFFVRTAMVLAAISTTAFPVLYAFSPWHKSRLGRAIMLQAVALAWAINLTTFLQFGPLTRGSELVMWLRLIQYILMSSAAAGLTWILYQLNHLTNRDIKEIDNERHHAGR